MDIERAISLAETWQKHELDECDDISRRIRNALLGEVERLRALLSVNSDIAEKDEKDEKRLHPMSEAPAKGEILAYHEGFETLHHVHWVHRGRNDGYWAMRWNAKYSQHDSDFLGWIPLPEVIVDGGEG